MKDLLPKLVSYLQENAENALQVSVKIITRSHLTKDWFPVLYRICDICDKNEPPPDLLKELTDALFYAIKHLADHTSKIERLVETILLHGHPT